MDYYNTFLTWFPVNTRTWNKKPVEGKTVLWFDGKKDIFCGSLELADNNKYYISTERGITIQPDNNYWYAEVELPK